MRLALQEACSAFDEGEVPVGAVIVLNDRVVAADHNRTEQLRDPIAHAEILAIRRTCELLQYERLAEATLYVTVEPCVMCAGAILAARIQQLVYGADNPKGGAVRSFYQLLEDARFNHQTMVTPGVLQAECSRLMSTFFQQLRAGEVPKWS